eukprot:3567045-Rhodomonas_salina.1
MLRSGHSSRAWGRDRGGCILCAEGQLEAWISLLGLSASLARSPCSSDMLRFAAGRAEHVLCLGQTLDAKSNASACMAITKCSEQWT